MLTSTPLCSIRRATPDFLAEVLTWPNNYYNAIAVETAVTMGLPPTSFITDKLPSEEWSREDKKLAMAWTSLKRETCGNCGQPLWICRSSNKNLTFAVRKATCYSKAEVEKFQNKKPAPKLKPGEYVYTVPTMLDKSPLPSRRDYLEELNDE
jgi:hypothetical protein